MTPDAIDVIVYVVARWSAPPADEMERVERMMIQSNLDRFAEPFKAEMCSQLGIPTCGHGEERP